MSFRLESASVLFQKAMIAVWNFFSWQSIILKKPDVTSFYQSPKKHVKNLEKRFDLLMAAKMTLTLKQCHFFSWVTRLAMIRNWSLTNSGLLKLEGESWATTITPNYFQPWFIIEWRNSYGRFILSGFAETFARHNKKLKIEKLLEFSLGNWGHQTESWLEEWPASVPVLAVPWNKGQCTVNTDAPDAQIDRMLLEKQDNYVPRLA